MSEEKKLTRLIKEKHEGEMKQVSSQVKTEYKKAKQKLKQVYLGILSKYVIQLLEKLIVRLEIWYNNTD